jgi:hypothetical protein
VCCRNSLLCIKGGAPLDRRGVCSLRSGPRHQTQSTRLPGRCRQAVTRTRPPVPAGIINHACGGPTRSPVISEPPPERSIGKITEILTSTTSRQRP